MPPKNSGGSTKFPGGHKVIHRTAQTAFVRVVTPRYKNALGTKDVFTRADSETFAAMREKKPPLRSSGYCKFFREFCCCPYYLGYLY